MNFFFKQIYISIFFSSHFTNVIFQDTQECFGEGTSSTVARNIDIIGTNTFHINLLMFRIHCMYSSIIQFDHFFEALSKWKLFCFLFVKLWSIFFLFFYFLQKLFCLNMNSSVKNYTSAKYFNLKEKILIKYVCFNFGSQNF